MNTPLLQRLRERGSEGADLSPGDPLCAEAADEIERLQLTLTHQCQLADRESVKVEQLRATTEAMQGIIRFYHGGGCDCDHCAEPVKLAGCKVFAPHFQGCAWCRCCGQHRTAHPHT